MKVREKDMNYFDALSGLAGYSQQAAKYFDEICSTYHAESIGEHVEKIHAIEHEADVKKHEMMRKLVREFITPIEREDIIQLAHLIDNVTDTIEDIVLGFYMFNVQELRPDIIEYAKVITHGTEKVHELMAEFKHFRKSKNLHELIVEINNLEEEGDRFYMRAMRNLYKEESDGKPVLIWTKLYNRMERACDAFEDVSEAIETVYMKNY